MNKKTKTRPRVPPSIAWRKRCQRILLLPALLLPPVQTAHAVDIYYARAIGHDFLPDTAPSTSAPSKPGQAPKQDLPGLGTQDETTPKAAAGAGMSTWSKVLIGAVVVGAIAALANKGGGGGDSGSGTSGSSQNTGTSGSGSGGSTPSGGGGAGPGIGIGGGGITVGGGNRRD